VADRVGAASRLPSIAAELARSPAWIESDHRTLQIAAYCPVMRLPFFRSRSPRREVTFVRDARAADHPAPPPPPPQPRVLVDVVGVGQTETVNSVALTLLSVERYREGHVVLFRMFRHRERSERDLPTPHFDLAVTPEGSTPYRRATAARSSSRCARSRGSSTARARSRSLRWTPVRGASA
jgi:hypothetical protein